MDAVENCKQRPCQSSVRDVVISVICCVVMTYGYGAKIVHGAMWRQRHTVALASFRKS